MRDPTGLNTAVAGAARCTAHRFNKGQYEGGETPEVMGRLAAIITSHIHHSLTTEQLLQVADELVPLVS